MMAGRGEESSLLLSRGAEPLLYCLMTGILGSWGVTGNHLGTWRRCVTVTES